MSRWVGEIAPKYLGQPVVVVNKIGAAGSAAAAEVISSKPDGYKLYVTSQFFFAMTTKTQKVPFDPGQLTPLANLMQLVDGICVRGDAPWKTFNDLLEYAKKNPRKLSWAHSGRGMVGHVSILLLFRKAGAETLDVPYKGPAEKLAALLGGHVDAASLNYATCADHIKAGKVRFLIFNTDRRYTQYEVSNVPTTVELGYADVAKLTPYIGFYIHKDTPEEVRRTLFDTFKKTYEDPAFKKGIEKIGDQPRFDGPEFMKESIKKGEEIALPMLKELGLYVEK
jgi:tripartite-type tricarboxylate transporter receptor subunit TctC